MAKRSKKAQVTIFIILGIAIVVGVLIFLFVKKTSIRKIPGGFEPVYNYYLSCIDYETSAGVKILGEQGGYIEQPEFSPGSVYMPFSSQLNFIGTGIPYWFYISANNLKKEQVPSLKKMESQLNEFLEERIPKCDFSKFEKEGFRVELEKPEVKTTIEENKVKVEVKEKIIINKGNSTWSKENHQSEIRSDLGKFYSIAKKIYDYNKKSLFLENYALDILRLYAPVDGSEIGCETKIWKIDDIREELTQALEANIPMIKVKGSYYEPKKENKYFVQDIGEDVDARVNFLFSRNWPLRLEVWPSENGILKAEPVGLQQGLGVLGFCYVPYHFVYDFGFPVLIQISSDEEIFQFPVVVYIDKNKPREALDVEGLPDVVPELCEYKNEVLEVYTYDTDLNPLESEIKFKCFDTVCDIGKTKLENGEAVLKAAFPECVNGFIIVRAPGYETAKYKLTTVEPQKIGVVLKKEYELEIEVQKGARPLYDEYALITFSKEKEDGTKEVKTLYYPQQKKINLTEDLYEIKAYIYSNSTIRLKGTSVHKCVKVPKSGIWGIFGVREEKCFNVEIPDQIISFAVSGGGKRKYYFTEDELKIGKLTIGAENFGIPQRVEDLQNNYNKVEISDLGLYFEE